MKNLIVLNRSCDDDLNNVLQVRCYKNIEEEFNKYSKEFEMPKTIFFRVKDKEFVVVSNSLKDIEAYNVVSLYTRGYKGYGEVISGDGNEQILATGDAVIVARNNDGELDGLSVEDIELIRSLLRIKQYPYNHASLFIERVECIFE